MDSKREGDHQYHNPDPLYHLIGPANEIESIIEGKVLPTLVDLGAQCSSITLDMVKELKLDLHPLDTLQLRGWGGVEVGYLGYTECTLEIPKVKGFKQDVLLLVVNNSEYRARVPILLGTLHINMILEEANLGLQAQKVLGLVNITESCEESECNHRGDSRGYRK